MQNNLDTRQVYAQVVDQPLDKANLLDIVIAEAPDIPDAPLRRNQPTALVHTQALLVHATQRRRNFN
jgi:hypothetical protein